MKSILVKSMCKKSLWLKNKGEMCVQEEYLGERVSG